MRIGSIPRWLVLGGALVISGCPDPHPKFSAPMMLGGQEVSAEVLNAGARVYAMRCASCHGHDGAGNGPAGGGFHEKPRDFRNDDFRYKSTPKDMPPSDADLNNVIRNGQVSNGMPAWPSLTDQDLHAVIQYIKTLSPKFAAPSPTGAVEEPAA